MLHDIEKDTTISGQFFSGGNPWGDPIPVGDYDILIRAGRPGFFRLEAIDGNYGDDKHQGTGRTYFRLHHPGRSIGCITANDWDNWNEIESFINSTRTDSVTIITSPAWTSANGNISIPAQSEVLTRYGRITVIP
jgi:hypothetical protein